MVFSQPSSPVLKARRQSHRLYSRALCGLFTVVVAVWFIRYVLFDTHLDSRKFTLPAPLKATVPPPTLVSTGGSQLGLSNVSAKDLGSTALSSHSPRPEQQVSASGVLSLTAVLPITPETLSGLDDHIRLLTRRSEALSEIFLLTPRQYLAKTRHTIQAILSKEEDFDVEISIKPWADNFEIGMATLQAAQQVSTDWVLLLDQDVLSESEGPDLNALLLKTRPQTFQPVGPRGIDYHLDGIVCVATATPSRAAFLVPPMVLPAALIPPTSVFTPGSHVWMALGNHVSRAQHDLSGGSILGSDRSSSNEWCSRYAPRGLDGNLLPMHVLPSSDQTADTLQPSAAIVTPEIQQDVSGSMIALVGPGKLQLLSRIICGLCSKGHTVTVLILENSTSDLPCDALVHILPQTDAPQSSSASLAAILPSNVDIILSTADVENPSNPLVTLVEAYPSATHIHIPSPDLHYTDWIATLDFAELKNWHVPEIQLSVITNDRPHSLLRLLSSLKNARYFGDKLDMRINLEQTADPKTLRMAGEFEWDHGNVFVHHRVIHGGLLTAVVESWYPNGNDSYGLILEDDVELSPLFYAYLKLALLRYRYGKRDNRSTNLFGISLYQQKNLELRPEGRHLFNARTLFQDSGLPHPNTPYLSQIPCSWGALYFPEHWREFHIYLGTRLSGKVWPLQQVVVPDVRSNRWTRSWKKYFIELVFLRGYVMLYPNYADYVSLSTNHLEIGSHVKDVPEEVYLRKKRLFNLPLMQLPAIDTEKAGPTGLLELPDERLPSWTSLPVLDLFGTIVDHDTITSRGAERRADLTGCEEAASQPHDARELLCVV
ncbi:hypothetical protein C8Q73DRAFT_828524 [Cubamyces lactineus]|nr:hypothetical protein C8Q73DRAFT_828524 [Cubamyces lactineus]